MRRLANWVLRSRPVRAFGTAGRKARVFTGHTSDHFIMTYWYPIGMKVEFSGTQLLKGGWQNYTRLYGSGANTPNVFDLRSDIGLSDFHAKHISNFSWIWDTPKFVRGGAVLKAVTADWQINGLVRLRTGLPVNILTGTSNQRPNAIGGPVLFSDRTKFAAATQAATR